MTAKAKPASEKTESVGVAFQAASLDIWDKKYRLKDLRGEPVDADVDATYRRVARALAGVEDEDRREHWYERFLWALRRGAIPAGRIVSNAGGQDYKPATSTINCTVSGTLSDSMDGILKKVHEAGLTLKAGCGIGYEFSTLRPRGAFVAGAGAITSGPLSFMDIFDRMCFTISSAGGRRGAQMATFDVGHPDVADFIRAKREDGRLRQFNLSLLITHEFMEAVKSDDWWQLAFPLTHKQAQVEETDLQDPEEVVWRDWPNRQEDYITRDDGRVACKVFRRLKARKLWNAIMSSTYDYAEPGFILVDQVNDLNNNWFDEGIRATNPCVTADTWVQTSAGPRRVADLVGTPFHARVDGTDHATGPEGFFYTADKPVVRLTTAEGYSLRLTADHRVRKVVRRTRWRTETDWVAAGDLAPGDQVLLHDHRPNADWEGPYTADEGYLLGLLVGDGTLKADQAVLSVWQSAPTADGTRASGPQAVMSAALAAAEGLPRRADFGGWREIPGRGESRLSLKALKDLAGELGMAPGNKAVTPAMERTSADFHRGFLRGLFDADGSVQGTRAKGVSVRLAQSDLPRLETVQRMLLRLGIKSTIYTDRRAGTGTATLPDGKGGDAAYTIRPQHELVIAGENLARFAAEIGFADTDKQTRLDRLLGGYKRALNRERFTARVAAVTAEGTEPVYDVQVPGVNAFDANGLHAHNCGEQPLPPFGACWTGSMRLTTNHGVLRTDEAFERVRQGNRLEVAVDDEFTGEKTDLRPCTLVQNGTRQVCEVRFDNGQRIELTEDHQVYTPGGWKRVDQLETGAEVHVQAREQNGLDLVDPFYLGALKYLFQTYAGDELVVTRQSRRALLRPILDQLRISYTERARGLAVSRRHPVMEEVERLDLEDGPESAIEGYVYAAQATAGHYKEKAAVFAAYEACAKLKRALERLGYSPKAPTRHRKESYRLILPEGLDIQAPAPENSERDLDFAVYGWLLADGWLTDSAGLVFSDQDDGAMQELAPRFKALTGTGGELRQAYSGQQRSVYSLACYRQAALDGLRGELGLDDYTSAAVRVPERIWQASLAQQASFLAAVFCADGSMDQGKLNIRLTSASREWLEDIQLMLLSFGIHGQIFPGISKGKVFHYLSLQHQDAYRYYRFIGFPYSSHKQSKLERLLGDKERWHEPKTAHVARVESITPLGEQPVYDIEEYSTHTLIVNGVVVHNCLLGSVNLTQFVREPFTDNTHFDWDAYREVVAVFTRMLDNVVEISGLPLDEQQREIERKRRHGMGFLGLGSTLTMLRMKYGDPDSVEFTERVARELAETGWRTGVELAREKGPAPIMEESFPVDEEMLRLRPEMKKDGYRPGDEVPGRVLMAHYSRYMQQFPDEVTEPIAEYGSRFTHHSSIAPTGTISLSLANNASNGIEPSFAHKYFRNVIRDGKKSKEKVEVDSYELLAYKHFIDPEADPDAEDPAHALPDYFVDTNTIDPRQHVEIQAAAQKWVDSSISKTINVPQDFDFEDFKDIYLHAYEKGLKGCTTFRYNPEVFQGVLVQEKDLRNTTYRFELADGSVVEARGDEEIEYDGETHNAANLYEALKEGYYGRF